MTEPDLCLQSYDYVLPPTCIAQTPAEPRDHARLMVVRDDRSWHHGAFYELPQWLQRGDVLVLNNTRVIPARMHGHKPSGVAVEILLLEPIALESHRWLSLVKPGKRLPVGSTIVFTESVSATVVGIEETSRARELQFHLPDGTDLMTVAAAIGQVPLPPYIHSSVTDQDADNYQTVYAEVPGAIAAPTAGLHFTPELLLRLQDMGVELATVTLHVGLGTFRPVESEDITQHPMHGEWCEVSAEVIAKIRAARSRGGRVIGVGSTVARALESSGMEPFGGKTSLMIYPGYQWQVLDGLITNFHLPKSSLLMMMSSFLGVGGRQFLLSLYQEAISREYRFYSYGDAMLLWRPGASQQ